MQKLGASPERLTAETEKELGRRPQVKGTSSMDVYLGNTLKLQDEVEEAITQYGRSLAIFDLERPLPRGFSLSVRYTGYFGLPTDSTSAYERHTVYLGLSYTVKRSKKPPAP